MNNKLMNPTIETGAMTLVLLVTNYRSQMINLLLKNGVTVPSGASNQQIATMMANLLKISKSFAMDLQRFISNPKVIEVLAGGFSQNAQYLRASGFAGKKVGNAQYFRASGYFNGEGDEEEDPSLPSTNTPPKTGFWSGLNLGNILSDGLNLFGQIDKNKTDRAIANAQAQISTNTGVNVGSVTGSGDTGSGKGTPDDEGMSTTTIVVLSLVGIAVIGTIIYFVARPKE
jgi:hypothetical protein